MRIKEAVVQALHKTNRTRPPEPAPGLISPQGAASWMTTYSLEDDEGTSATPMIAVGFKSAANDEAIPVIEFLAPELDS